ncbi:MAG TPA: hypothetical protein VMM38_01330 [Aridibacter sp.]|nr:hypothetical protein [Aridibacter sp.]
MSNQKARPGDTVELANKEIGFNDPATGFKIVRTEKQKLGKSIGNKTNLALSSGALLIVGRAKKKEPETRDTGLPEDLPGREAFEAEGLSFDQVKKLSPEDLVAVKGIGEKTAESLAEYLAGAGKE